MTAYTLLITCPPGIDLLSQEERVTSRLGMCHGFALIGVRAKLIKVQHLGEALLQEENIPIVWLHAGDYEHVNIHALKGVIHFVEVPPDRFFVDLPRIKAGGPAFVHGTCPRTERWVRAGYQMWRDAGLVVTGIPRACDTVRYYPDAGAQHQIPFPKTYHEERETFIINALSQDAVPDWHARTGQTTEHGFKVLGSGGLTIFKGAQYRDVFLPGKVLIAETDEEYAKLRDRALTDKEWNLEWRGKGFVAVRERHTYQARARQVMATLGLMDYGDGRVH